MVLLPSEKARLVLGYLREQECYQAYKEFLISSPHLKELRGMIRKGAQPHEYEWKMRGLSNMLDEYSSIECSICALANSHLVKHISDANSVARKVEKLIEFLNKNPVDAVSFSNRDGKTLHNELSKTNSTKYSIRSKLKNEERKNIPSTSITIEDGNPIITDIPESVLSDESTDLCSLGFSPVQNNETVVEHNANQLLKNSDSFIGGNSCKRAKAKNDSKKDQNKSNNSDTKFNIFGFNEGFDISLISETLLNRTDIHEKIAENINKLYLSSAVKNDDDNKTNETPEKLVEQAGQNVKEPEIVDLEAHLNGVIRDIVNATEKDNAFDELLDDLVAKVAEEIPCSTSSEDTSPSRPATSTPENACRKSSNLVLNTTSSAAKNILTTAKSTGQAGQDIEKDSKNTSDDSIKYRLRNRNKVNDEQLPCNSKNNSEQMEIDKTPLKPTKQVDLLAMAINDADVSGSLRKMNPNNNKNENKIVILSNELVHRNLSEYKIGNNDLNKIGNSSASTDSSASNTHFILPTVNTNNMFLNSNMTQYLVTGGTEDDQNKVFLINAPLNLPVQNNEMTDIMTMPTFIVLPQPAPVINDNSTINYQQIPKSTKKPKAVILPQPEQSKSQQKKLPITTSLPNCIVISEQSALHKTDMPKLNVTLDENKPETSERRENDAAIKTSSNPKCSDSKKQNSEEISITKAIDFIERETPDLAAVQIKQRTSLSTPRRSKSHVRVLDFNTPPKTNDGRKAATSPKLGHARISPKTVQKKDTKDPIRSALFRSPKSKCTYIFEEENEAEAKTTKQPDSPAVKLNGGWDSVQGLALIFGDKSNVIQKNPDSSVESSHSSIMKSECESQESGIEAHITTNSQSDELKFEKNTEKSLKKTEKHEYKSSPFKKKNVKPKILQKNKWDSDLRSMLQSPAELRYNTRLMSKINNKSEKKKKTKTPRATPSKVEQTTVTTDEKLNCLSAKVLLQTSKELISINTVQDIPKSNIENCDLLKKDTRDTNENTKVIQIDDMPENNPNDSNNSQKKQESKQCSKNIDKKVFNSKNSEISETSGFTKNESDSKNNVNKSSDTTNSKPPAGKEVLDNKFKLTHTKILHDTNCEDKNENNKGLVDESNIKKLESKSESKIEEEKRKLINPPVNIQDESAVFMTNEIKQNADNLLKQTNSNSQVNNKFINFEDLDNSRQRCDLKTFNNDHNSSDAMLLLETPFKLEDGAVPKTPRFLTTSQVEDTPLSKIKRNTDNNSLTKCGIPTPNFPLTPSASASSTPDLKNSEDPEKQEEKNSSSSYYKPDQSEGIDISDKNKMLLKPGEITKATKENEVEDKDCNKTNNESSVMDISSSSSSSSSSDSSSSSSDSYSSSNSSCSSEDSVVNSSFENSFNTTNKSQNKENKISSSENINIRSTQISSTETEKCSQEPSKTGISVLEPPKAENSFTKRKIARTNTANQKINNKLLQELDEKRLRILNKVKADLALKTSKPTKSKGKSTVANKLGVTKPHIKSLKNNTGRNIEGNFVNKIKVDEKCANIKNRRKSDSPKKRCLPDKVPKNSDTNNLHVNEKEIDENLDSSFPNLHISEDESECGDKYEKTKQEQTVVIPEAKAETVVVAEETSASKQNMNNEQENSKVPESEKQVELLQECEKSDTSKQAENAEAIQMDQISEKVTEITNNENEIQTNNKCINISGNSDSKSVIDEKETNINIHSDEALETPKESINVKEQNKNNNTEKTLSENINSQKCMQDKEIEKSSTELPVQNISDKDIVYEEESSDDECSFDFSIHENTIYEECFEDESLRKKDKPEQMDGFDINNFRVNVGEEGVLTITKLVTLLDIPPVNVKNQKILPKIQKINSDQKETVHKQKNRKTPLNILFESIVPEEKIDKKQITAQKNMDNRTPCANLYEESPRKGKYDQKKESKSVHKKSDGSRKKSTHEDTRSSSKKSSHKERSENDNASYKSSSSSRDEKSIKRKRSDETDIFLSKKNKTCNPQLFKDFDVDKVLDVIHGKE